MHLQDFVLKYKKSRLEKLLFADIRRDNNLDYVQKFRGKVLASGACPTFRLFFHPYRSHTHIGAITIRRRSIWRDQFGESTIRIIEHG